MNLIPRVKTEASTKLLPTLFVSNEIGITFFDAPDEKQPKEVLEPAGLDIVMKSGDGNGHILSGPSDLLHGIDKPITSFTDDGKLFAVYHNGNLRMFCTETKSTLLQMKLEGRVEFMALSPLGTYLTTWSRIYKGDIGPNLIVYRVINASIVEAVYKLHERRQPAWPVVQFTSDESVACILRGGAVQVFEKCAFQDTARIIKFPGVTKFSIFGKPGLSTVFFALFKPEVKGEPARVNIYGSDDYACVKASKTFFRAETLEFHWSPNGSVVLLQTYTDTSSDTYYGESNLYLLHTDASYDCVITRTKPGPLHAVAWSPKGTEFTVIAGNFPANITVYNPKTGAPYFELGAAARNTLCYSPHGRFLCVAGFGSLRGDMDFWDMNKRKVMGTANGSCAIKYSWSPCGRWFVIASTYPRMQVDNWCKIYRYNGEGPVCRLAYERLFAAGWVPAMDGVYPDRPQDKKKKNKLLNLNGDSGHTVNIASEKRVYRPPGLKTQTGSRSGHGRSLADMLGETGVGTGKVKNFTPANSGSIRVIPGLTSNPGEKKKSKRKKKKSKATRAPEPAVTSKPQEPAKSKYDIDYEKMSPEELQRQMKRIKKRLKQIDLLKNRQENLEQLNADQIEKICKEDELLALFQKMEAFVAHNE